MQRGLENVEYWKIPVYQAFTKDLMVGGIPMSMAAILIALIALAVLILHNFYLVLIFLLLYVIAFLMVKFSKKFDPKVIDILVRMILKKYIDN